MTNRPKQIGTWTETSIVLYLRANGFGGADEMSAAQRITLHGSTDHGDVGVCPGVMIESKGGHAAENASDAQIAVWLDETELERMARGADVAALVTKRKGKGRASAGQWWAHLPGWAYLYLAMSQGCSGAFNPASFKPIYRRAPAVRLPLAALVDLLRGAGYGDPLGPSRKDTTTP